MTLILREPLMRQPQVPRLRRELRQYLSASIVGGSPVWDGCGPVALSGGITVQGSPQGLAYVGDATDNIAYAAPRIDGSYTGSDQLTTFICVFRKVGSGVDTNTIAGYGSTTGSSGNTLFRLIGGGTATNIRLQHQTGAGTVLYNTDSSGVTVNDDQWHCAVVTVPITGVLANDVLAYYIDGKQAGTVSRIAGAASTTFDRVSVCGGYRGSVGVAYGNFHVAAFVALRGTLMTPAWCLDTSRLDRVWANLFGDRRILAPVSASGGGSWTVTLTDTASATDAYTPSLDTLRALTDTASATDSLTAAVDAVVALLDAASASDLLTAAAVVQAVISDLAGASDTSTAAVDATVALTDAASATDTATGSFEAAGTVALSDLASANDSLTCAATLLVTLADSASGTDAYTAAAELVRTLTDTASATDTITASIPGSWDVTLTDLAAAVDVIAAVIAGADPAVAARYTITARARRLVIEARARRLEAVK